MESDQVVHGELRPLGRLEEIRAVVVRWNLDLGTRLNRKAIERFREPEDRRLGGGRCEAKRVEAHDHRRVRRNCTSFTRGVPGVGERASADRERVVDPVAELDEERAVAKRAYA